MNTIPSPMFSTMDSLLNDDQMDLASSPFPQPDELDLDVDTMRDPSVASMQDDMIEDLSEHPEYEQQVFHNGTKDTIQDDVMVDEEIFDDQFEDKQDEYSINVEDQPGEKDEDEEILYEDEEDVIATPVPDQDEILDALQDQEVDNEPISLGLGNDENSQATWDREDHQYGNDLDDVFTDKQEIEDVHNESPQNLESEEIASASQKDEVHGQVDNPRSALESSLDEDNNHSDVYAAIENFQDQAQQPETEDLNSQRADATTKEISEHQESAIPSADEHDAETINFLDPNPNLYLVKIVYLGEEMSLFPPSTAEESKTFFLSDPNLAFQSFDGLLGACRDILSGSIGHDDELVLDVQALGLHICEDSKYAAQLTLSQVLETYLTLCTNENIDRIQPLVCNLSSRVSLASQYTYLLSASKEGKTFTDVSADYVDSPYEDDGHDNDVPNDKPSPSVHEETESTAHAEENHASTGDFDGGEAAHMIESEPQQIAEGENDLEQDHDISTSLLNQTDDTKSQNLQQDTSEHVEESKAQHDDTPKNQSPDQEIPNTLDQTANENSSQDNASLQHSHTLDDDEANLEAETNSSHTLQADYATSFDQNELEVPFEDDDDDETPQAIGEYDNALGHVEEQHDAEIYQDLVNDDDDLFESEHEGSLSLLEESNQQQNSLSDKTHNVNQREDEEDHGVKPASVPLDEGFSEEINVIPQSGTNETRQTPIKSKMSKRKNLEDDDEFDLLDSATPEPKRRRPS